MRQFSMEHCRLCQTKLDIPTVFFPKSLYLHRLCLEDSRLGYSGFLTQMIVVRMAISSGKAAHSSGNPAASLIMGWSRLLENMVVQRQVFFVQEGDSTEWMRSGARKSWRW